MLIPAMEFKWDVSLGSVLTALTFLVSLLGIYTHAAMRFSQIERKINILFTWWTREIFKNGPPDPEIAKDIQKFFG